MEMRGWTARLFGLTVATAGFTAVGVSGARAGDVLLSAAVGNETVQLVELSPKVMQVVVNEKVVYEDRDGASFAFVNAYNLQGRWLVLLQQSAGEGCAARYRVLDLSGPKPSVSLPFGTCSNAPEIALADRALTVSMPLPDAKGAAGKGSAAWSYQDGQLVRLR